MRATTLQYHPYDCSVPGRVARKQEDGFTAYEKVIILCWYQNLHMFAVYERVAILVAAMHMVCSILVGRSAA
jgi:hypothetical protein